MTFLLVLFAVVGNAKSMKDIWATIPDSLLPYIDRTHRLEMTDFIGMGLKGDVDNIMGSKSVMDTITDNFIQVTLSEASILQIKKMQQPDGDSILCLVQTWNGPESESVVNFYDQQWQRLDKNVDLKSYIPQLLIRPDTMSMDNYDKLLGNIDFSMVKANLSPNSDELTITLSVPIADNSKKKLLKPLIKSLALKP